MSNTLQAGADTDAYCNRCKLVLAHVIIAMRGSRPARVECKTCGAAHAYKSDKPAKRTTRRATTKSSEVVTQAEYDTLMAGRDVSRAIRYKPAHEFDLDDVVDHRTFGLGLVTKVISGGKIEVAFQNGSKVLVHARV